MKQILGTIGLFIISIFCSSIALAGEMQEVSISNRCTVPIDYFSDWKSFTTIQPKAEGVKVQMHPDFFFDVALTDSGNNHSEVIECLFIPELYYTGVRRSPVGAAHCNDKITVTVSSQREFVVTCSP